MPAPCNAKYIPLGFTPWNLYPARNVNTNGHIEVECFNSLTPDGTIPLGICNSSIRFSPKAPPTQCSWSFFMSICVEPHGLASLGLIYPPLEGNPVAPLGSADSLRELLDLVARHPARLA